MQSSSSKVTVFKGSITLPTYDIKAENRNPVFRSQYGVAHIYPYTLLDDIEARSKDKDYRTLVLENEYLRVTILPDLGGRVYSVFDKVSQREVFYKNSVVRFAPLAIRGAFFSGGLEFSFPVAHSPTSCDKVNWDSRENKDGSASVFIGGTEHMSGLRWMVTLTLYPGRCALAQDVFLYNPGNIPGRYHYWTNTSLDANDGTEFIYPLHRVRSYEFAGTSSWPIARLDLILGEPGLPGMEGVPMWPAKRMNDPINFRWQKNMLAQVSIFGRDVEWDYFGAWQHRVNHGYAHVARSKDVSGMKLWSWGNAPVGIVNQTSLTDDGSVYAETQCGAMETQLDFAFLEPGNTRTWREWWLPLRGIGGLTCANEAMAAKIQLIPDEAGEIVRLKLAICPAVDLEDAHVRMAVPGSALVDEVVKMSPGKPWSGEVTINGHVLADKPISLQVKDKDGRMIFDFLQKREADPFETVDPASAHPDGDAEGSYQQGLKFENFDNREQAREAYRKALGIAPDLKDAHLRYGLMLLRSAEFSQAAAHFTRAAELDDPSGDYYRANVALLLNKLDEAEKFFKAASVHEPIASLALMGLGKIAIRRKQFECAVDTLEKACALSGDSIASELLLAVALRQAGKMALAEVHLTNILARDPLNLPALHETAIAKGSASEVAEEKLDSLLSDDHAYFLDLACYYLDCGLPCIALEVVKTGWRQKEVAMEAYVGGYAAHLAGNEAEGNDWLRTARSASPEFGFPSRLEEVLALEFALTQNADDHQAKYFLGNFLYARERYEEGIQLWQDALMGMPQYDVLLRNLGLAFWQRKDDFVAAAGYFEQALAVNPQNQDLYLLLDDLYKLQGMNDKRAGLLEKIKSLADVREDVHKRTISILTDLGYYQQAIQMMEEETFLPLEMDQSFHKTFVQALMLRAAEHLNVGRVEEAVQDYLKMLKYPENLGVGAPTTRTQAQTYYLLGLAYEKLGKFREAIQAWHEAASEHHEIHSELFPYVQMSLDKLGRYSDLGLEICRREEGPD